MNKDVMFIVGRQFVPNSEDLNNIRDIVKNNKYDPIWAALLAYSYGVIQGIRKERKRRNARVN